MWQRDPYAIYAEYILKLKALEPLVEKPGFKEFGTAVHRTLELFFNAGNPKTLDFLLENGRTELEACGLNTGFWKMKFEGFISFFHTKFLAEAHEIAKTFPEAYGTLGLEGFTLKGRADRIDLLTDGTLRILDYKTGGAPSKKEVSAGFKPQLLLEALMLEEGSVKDIPPAGKVSRMEYWHPNTENGGKASPALGKASEEEMEAAVARAKDGLLNLIRHYRIPENGYEATPRLERAPKYSDYEHLGRTREWGVSGENAEEGALGDGEE